MSKKALTREAILQQAVRSASQIGISRLTIGSLAEQSGLSKSGLFAHFGSKEALQLAVVQAAQAQFVEQVVKPAFARPRGMARLSALFEAWVMQLYAGHQPGGCPLLAAAYEFDDQPGAIRDALVAGQRWQRDTLLRLLQDAQDAGELAPGSDVALLAFMLFGLIQSAHHDHQLLGSQDSARLALQGFRQLCARDVGR
jgi:AcrR family transcriptional regulator